LINETDQEERPNKLRNIDHCLELTKRTGDLLYILFIYYPFSLLITENIYSSICDAMWDLPVSYCNYTLMYKVYIVTINLRTTSLYLSINQKKYKKHFYLDFLFSTIPAIVPQSSYVPTMIGIFGLTVKCHIHSLGS